MKKNKLFKRILACALVLCISFAMCSVNVFAAEETAFDENGISVSEPSGVSTMSSGDVLNSGMATITNSATISLRLSRGNWSTDFCATVLGNAGARYEVVMTEPDGTQYTTYITGGSNNLSLIVTMLYASPGTYKFKFTRISGSATSARAIAEIRD